MNKETFPSRAAADKFGESMWKEMTPAATAFETALKRINKQDGTVLEASGQELADLKKLAEAYVKAAEQFISEEKRREDDLYLQAKNVLATEEPAEL